MGLDLDVPGPAVEEREPFRNKKTVIRNLRAGDRLHMQHHTRPRNTRAVEILLVSRWQMLVTPLPGGDAERSIIVWPPAVAFRIDGPRIFALTRPTPGGRLPYLTFTLLE